MPPKSNPKSVPKTSNRHRSSRRRRHRRKPRFTLLSKYGKEIDAKLDELVDADIAQHRKLPREKYDGLLASLSPDMNQKTRKFVPSLLKAKEGASVTFIPKTTSSVKKTDVLKYTSIKSMNEVAKQTPQNKESDKSDDDDEDEEVEVFDAEDEDDDEPQQNDAPKSAAPLAAAPLAKVTTNEKTLAVKSKSEKDLIGTAKAAAKTNEVLKSIATEATNDGKGANVGELHQLIREIKQDIEKSLKATPSAKAAKVLAKSNDSSAPSASPNTKQNL